MNLGFKERFDDGSKTYFPALIWDSLIPEDDVEALLEMGRYCQMYADRYGHPWDMVPVDEPRDAKIHTLRTDKSDRWKPGMRIHFKCGNRYEPGGQFQFAPVCRCHAIEKVTMFSDGARLFLYVGGRALIGDEMEQFARNDGFRDSDHMASWFFPETANVDETDMAKVHLKLIHWTAHLYTPDTAQIYQPC